jgi:SAM-dependent methyltransferase
MINTSHRIRAVDFSQQWFKSRAEELSLDSNRMHRKIWEFAIVAQVFQETIQSLLSSAQYIDSAIGFGCGKEPIPAYIASYGTGVMATDAPIDNSEWTRTGQRVTGKSDIPWKGICHEMDLENLTFRQVDMNNIPDDLLRGQFDFSWSCGSLEHIGGLDQSIAFFCNQMRCLRPGGIAAHTTEFNPFDTDETLNDRNLCLFRKRDLIRLRDRLKSQGDRLYSLDLSPGDMPEDMIVDEEPYTGKVHLSIKVGKWTTTSALLIAQKG